MTKRDILTKMDSGAQPGMTTNWHINKHKMGGAHTIVAVEKVVNEANEDCHSGLSPGIHSDRMSAREFTIFRTRETPFISSAHKTLNGCEYIIS